MSSIQWRTTRPAWRQTLELALRGGEMCASGFFQSTAARTTSLQMQVQVTSSRGPPPPPFPLILPLIHPLPQPSPSYLMQSTVSPSVSRATASST